MFKDIIVGVTPTGVDACAVEAAVNLKKRLNPSFTGGTVVWHGAGLGFH